MFYRKNLPAWERACRIFVGLALICAAVLLPLGNLWMWIAVGAGVIAACTGFIGFCPMCAMVGRKPQSGQ